MWRMKLFRRKKKPVITKAPVVVSNFHGWPEEHSGFRNPGYPPIPQEPYYKSPLAGE